MICLQVIWFYCDHFAIDFINDDDIIDDIIDDKLVFSFRAKNII